MGNIHEHARSAFDIDVFEKRRGKSHISSHDTAVFALSITGTHESRATLEHDLTDIGKVNMHKAMTEHDATNALHCVAKDFVSHLEGFIHSGLLVGGLEKSQKFLIFDNDDGVNSGTEGVDTFLCNSGTSVTFEAERLGNHGNREDTEFAGNVCHHRSSPCTRTAAHTGSHEHHVSALHGFLDIVQVFFSSLATDFGVHAGTQVSGGLFANQNLVVSEAQIKRHCIGIDGIVFHTFNIHTLHAVHSIAAGSADAEHLDLGIVEGWFLAHYARLYLEVEVIDFTHVFISLMLSVDVVINKS